MGARGPLKLPSHLSVVSDKPTGSAAETVKRELPAAPPNLTEEERELWDPLVQTLHENGLTSRADSMVIHALIKHYLMVIRASDELAAADSLISHDDKNGRDMKHPAHQIMKDHSAALLQYANALGMSFTSRARTAAPQRDSGVEKNPFA